MGRIAVACYRPEPGMDDALMEIVRLHVPALLAKGFVTERPPVVMRAADGTIIEIFEWASVEAKQLAHEDPTVQRLWMLLSECATSPTLAELEEAQQQFCNFDSVDM